MNYTEHYKGIKLDVQAVDITIDDAVQQTVRQVVDKLLKHTAQINFADCYFKAEKHNATNSKYVSMRIGIPGPDVFAEDSGDYFEPLLKRVGDKLARQLDKLKH